MPIDPELKAYLDGKFAEIKNPPITPPVPATPGVSAAERQIADFKARWAPRSDRDFLAFYHVMRGTKLQPLSLPLVESQVVDRGRDGYDFTGAFNPNYNAPFVEQAIDDAANNRNTYYTGRGDTAADIVALGFRCGFFQTEEKSKQFGAGGSMDPYVYHQMPWPDYVRDQLSGGPAGFGN